MDEGMTKRKFFEFPTDNKRLPLQRKHMSQVVLGLDGSLSGSRLDASGTLGTLRRRPVRVLSRTFLGTFSGARKEVDDLSELVLGNVNARVQRVADALDELVGACGGLDVANADFLCNIAVGG